MMLRTVQSEPLYHTWEILVVDDEYDSIQVLIQLLHYYGVAVHVARSGRECLAMLRDMTPTAIIMDLAMPHMTGWLTLEAIRTTSSLATLPVIAITSYHSEATELEATAAGFDAYVHKPIDIHTFMTTLSDVINRAPD
ncbi:MAG: response regulator [Chloroflexi bacterium]|nr:response regulator [Chloroflexota bacterium]